jgi:hypothetical protein
MDLGPVEKNKRTNKSKPSDKNKRENKMSSIAKVKRKINFGPVH